MVRMTEYSDFTFAYLLSNVIVFIGGFNGFL